MRKNKKIIKFMLSLLCISCIILVLSSNTYALDTGKFTDIYKKDGNATLYTIGGSAFGIAQVVGMGTAIIGMIVLGIKYMISSTDEKATIKEKAVIYVTGLIIIFSASGLIGMLGNWAQTTVK